MHDHRNAPVTSCWLLVHPRHLANLFNWWCTLLATTTAGGGRGSDCMAGVPSNDQELPRTWINHAKYSTRAVWAKSTNIWCSECIMFYSIFQFSQNDGVSTMTSGQNCVFTAQQWVNGFVTDSTLHQRANYCVLQQYQCWSHPGFTHRQGTILYMLAAWGHSRPNQHDQQGNIWIPPKLLNWHFA